jgi:hypothetical protein
MAEEDGELGARRGGSDLALGPAKLRLVEIAVGVDPIALGDAVDRDQAIPGRGLTA